MSRVPTIEAAFPAGVAAERGASTLRDGVRAVVRDFGPLAVALAGGALLGVASTGVGPRGAFPAGSAALDLALVVIVASSASAAILPRAIAASSRRAEAQLPQVGAALSAQRVFAIFASALVSALVYARGLDATIAWAPLVLLLQAALAVGLGFFATALSRTRLGRLLPARVLVPAWLLATPGAWLLHAPTAESAPAWNPLHHLVAAWRAVLLPGVGTSEPIGAAVLALAPAALLCVVLGFAALAASEPGPEPSQDETRA
jgi:hypothetical protein